MTTQTKGKTKKDRNTKAKLYGRKQDRKAYKQTQTKHLADKLEKLSNEIVTDTDRLTDFINLWQGGFHNYSFHNTLLIWSQKPEATLCAGFRQWQEKHNRKVNKGEHGLMILVPVFHKETVTEDDTGEEKEISFFVHRFTTGYVFDISQTDGDPVEIGASKLINGKSKLTFEKLTSLFPEYILKLENENITSGSTDGKHITVAKAKHEAMIACYIHELGHNECKHFDKKRREKTTRSQRELEAEAVSYLVCSYLGIDNQASKLYIGGWKGDKSKLENSGKVILSAAERIIRRIKESK